MQSRSTVVYFYPALLIIFSWLAIIAVRNYSLIKFDGISTESSMYLLFFFLSFLLGALIGPLLCSRKKSQELPIYNNNDVERKAAFVIFLAYFAIALLIIKFISLTGSFTFSVSEITDLRLTRGRDPNEVKGGLVSGVLGTAFAGSTIIAYMFGKYYEKTLSSKTKIQLSLVFFIGIFVSFLSGGRWAAATALLIAYLTGKLYNLIADKKNACTSLEGSIRKSRSRFNFSLFIKIAVFLIVIYIFSIMFIERAMDSEDAVSILINVLNNNFEGISVSDEHERFLINNSYLIPIYFVVSLFQYYVGHAFYQFDVLFSEEFPRNAPYYFAYQGYLYVTLINKLGVGVITAQEILSEIVNPGVYFTLAGAFYLDFGFWGAGLSVFILSIIGSISWVLFLTNKSFFYFYISNIYGVLIIFSPIVSMMSTGVYPSLMLLTIFLFFLTPKKRF